MSPIGTERHFAVAQQNGRFRAKADIDWQAKPTGSVENDPKQTLGRAKFRSATTSDATLAIAVRYQCWFGAADAMRLGRREFIALLGGGAAWPLAAGAQAKRPKIGMLVPADPEPFWTEFRAGLDQYGYAEGKNITFEFRSADSKPERLRGLADELVRLKVDIIVASLTPAVTAARQATTDIPIIMAAAADPVATGLISSLARPGGNITGRPRSAT
jgi:ABC transporter substrate binding protein